MWWYDVPTRHAVAQAFVIEPLSGEDILYHKGSLPLPDCLLELHWYDTK